MIAKLLSPLYKVFGTVALSSFAMLNQLEKLQIVGYQQKGHICFQLTLQQGEEG